MNCTINTALAISFIIGTALQAIMFITTIALRHYAIKSIDEAKDMTDEANRIAAEAERVHEGSMLCMEMANELSMCHTKDERANLVIKWMPKLQDAGIDIADISRIIED